MPTTNPSSTQKPEGGDRSNLSKAGRLYRWYKSRHWAWRLVSALLLFLLLVPAIQVAYVKVVDPSTTGPILLRDSREKAAHPTKGITWRPISEVSQDFLVCVWQTEDARFFLHNGFDWKAIQRVLAESGMTGARVRGASTITQQCARSLFLWQGRSWIRKGLEAYYTIWMELLLSKKRIMELYVNVIELGNGVYGLEAAAQYHFGVSAEELNPDRAAALVAIMPNPRNMDPKKPDSELDGRLSLAMAKYRGVADRLDISLSPDHTGSKLAYMYVKAGDRGVAIFDVKTGSTRELKVSQEPGKMFGWSRDGRYLVFLQKSKWATEGRLTVYDDESGTTGFLTRELNVTERSFTWLTNNTYFFISKSSSGKEQIFWGDLTSGSLKKVTGHLKAERFTAVSESTAAFVSGPNIFKVSLPLKGESEAPVEEQVTEFAEADFEAVHSLRYEPETSHYLFLGRSPGAKTVLYSFDAQKKKLSQMTQSESADPHFLPHGNGVVFIEHANKKRKVVVRAADPQATTNLFTNGRAISCSVSPGADRVYVYGSLTSQQPAGLWEYDLNTRSLATLAGQKKLKPLRLF